MRTLERATEAWKAAAPWQGAPGLPQHCVAGGRKTKESGGMCKVTEPSVHSGRGSHHVPALTWVVPVTYWKNRYKRLPTPALGKLNQLAQEIAPVEWAGWTIEAHAVQRRGRAPRTGDPARAGELVIICPAPWLDK